MNEIVAISVHWSARDDDDPSNTRGVGLVHSLRHSIIVTGHLKNATLVGMTQRAEYHRIRPIPLRCARRDRSYRQVPIECLERIASSSSRSEIRNPKSAIRNPKSYER